MRHLKSTTCADRIFHSEQRPITRVNVDNKQPGAATVGYAVDASALFMLSDRPLELLSQPLKRSVESTQVSRVKLEEKGEPDTGWLNMVEPLVEPYTSGGFVHTPNTHRQTPPILAGIPVYPDHAACHP